MFVPVTTWPTAGTKLADKFVMLTVVAVINAPLVFAVPLFKLKSAF